MRLGQVAADHQTQAHAFGLGGGEGLEQAWPDVFRDAGPVVAHANLDFRPLRPRRDANVFACNIGLGKRFDGVAQQIEQDGFRLDAIRPEHGQAITDLHLDGDAVALCARRRSRHHRLHQFPHREGLQRAGTAPIEVAQAVHHVAGPAGFGGHLGNRIAQRLLVLLGFFRHQLTGSGVGDDGREGLIQFMRHG